MPASETIPEDVMELARELRSRVNWSSNASVQAIAEFILAERVKAAQIGYRVCARTRHVALGDEVYAAIRSGDHNDQ